MRRRSMAFLTSVGGRGRMPSFSALHLFGRVELDSEWRAGSGVGVGSFWLLNDRGLRHRPARAGQQRFRGPEPSRSRWPWVRPRALPPVKSVTSFGIVEVEEPQLGRPGKRTLHAPASRFSRITLS